MDNGSPQPQAATDGAEFVAAMRQLRQWAHLSFRDLERRAQDAGDVLPRATLAGVLSRQELPREELLAAFVRACGGDEATVETWISVRKRLAVDLERPAATTETAQQREAVTVPAAEGPMPPVASDELQEADAAVEVSGPDTVLEQDASCVRPAAPAEDEAQGTGTAADAETGGEPSKSPASRRGRRPALIITLSLVMLVLAAGVTGIALLPDDDSGRPKQPKAPAVTNSASSAPTSAAKPTTARASTQPDAAETPSPNKKPRATTTSPSKDGSRPTPKPSGSDPTVPPYEPGPWEPPSSTPSSPPASTGDPFPEETCWDANDCP